MLAAQQAAIGARICTVRAIRTIGRNFRNRRRIKESTLWDVAKLIMQRVLSRDQVPDDSSLARRYELRKQDPFAGVTMK
jgi:hypothetical protein